MSSSSSELIRLVDASLPPTLQRAMLRCLFGSYGEAEEECREKYSWQGAHDMRGHTRRAKVERNLELLIEREDDIFAAYEANEKNNCYHLELCAGRVVLTASVVPTPYALPRDARFRSTLARSPQLALGFMPQKPVPADDTPLYVMLLHGPDEDDPGRVGFAHLVVPDEDCTTILARIDLFARFAELPELRPAAQLEAIADELPVLKVRQRPRAQESGT